MSKKQDNLSELSKEYGRHVIELFEAMCSAVSKMPIETIRQHIIRLAENSNHPLKKELELLILKLISDEFNVTTEDIVSSDKRGEVVTAKKVAFVLFKSEIPMTEYKIAKYFNRSAPIVNRGVHSITSLVPLTKSEHAIVDGFTNILKQVTEWKKQVNYKNIVFSVETTI